MLLLDEPLDALDLNLRTRMQRELRDLHQRLGVTFVYVTHDQDEALMLSDRIAVMSEGAILQIGAPRKSTIGRRRPSSRGFLGDSNLIPGQVVRQVDTTVFRLADGTEVPLDTAAPAGNRAMLSVRSERLRPMGREKEAGVTLRGPVEGRRFRGAAVMITLRLADGTALDFVVPNDGSVEPGAFGRGEVVRLGLDSRHARLLPEAE